jgi:hypothetical protein
VGHHQLRFAVAGKREEPEKVEQPKTISPNDDTISTDVSAERQQWSALQ